MTKDGTTVVVIEYLMTEDEATVVVVEDEFSILFIGFQRNLCTFYTDI